MTKAPKGKPWHPRHRIRPKLPYTHAHFACLEGPAYALVFAALGSLLLHVLRTELGMAHVGMPNAVVGCLKALGVAISLGLVLLRDVVRVDASGVRHQRCLWWCIPLFTTRWSLAAHAQIWHQLEHDEPDGFSIEGPFGSDEWCKSPSCIGPSGSPRAERSVEFVNAAIALARAEAARAAQA